VRQFFPYLNDIARVLSAHLRTSPLFSPIASLGQDIHGQMGQDIPDLLVLPTSYGALSSCCILLGCCVLLECKDFLPLPEVGMRSGWGRALLTIWAGIVSATHTHWLGRDGTGLHLYQPPRLVVNEVS